MSSDIVSRLRELEGDWMDVDKHDFRDAADTIISLQKQIDDLVRIADGIKVRRQARGFCVPEDTTDLLNSIAKMRS